MSYYKPLIKRPITGNRLVVWFSMLTCDFLAKLGGRRHRFASLNEARVFAEQNDFDDGIHIKVSQGYGLKRKVDALSKGRKSEDQ